MTSRDQCLARIREGGTWDLVVIGGGATGLGTAVDAAARGYRTLLLEADDFAQGTSSRSTKLIHGGVRYLAQGNIGLVREALHERGLLIKNAPHLVHNLAFLIPAYSWWEGAYYGLGLWTYDWLARDLGLSRSHRVTRDEAQQLATTLKADQLRGGVVFRDGQFDDARLAVALAQTIDDHGGTALNRVAVTGLLKSAEGLLTGVVARDTETEEICRITTRGLVNATGVFADQVRRLDDPASPSMLTPSQGSHIVTDRSFLPGSTAVLIPKTDDGRVLFAIPWHDRVIVGTTDTPVARPEREPHPLPEEIEFLLTHAARYLARAPTPDDVRSTYAGLRPLISARHDSRTRTARLSREHAVVVSTSGLVTITGGKWTTYRRMGQAAVDKVAEVAGLPSRPCRTAALRLHGWHDGRSDGPYAPYGADAPAVARLVAERPEWADLLHPRLPYRAGEVVWAARHEAARSVEDILARRTRALVVDARASVEAAPRVAALLAEELGRDDRWQEEQITAYRTLASGYILA
jgi:glycerol-3-phosphate dehydrogenase